MDYQSFQSGGQNQNQTPIGPPPVPEIPKIQNLSERLRPYRWHIAIVGVVIIGLLYGAYSYSKYLAQQNDDAVAKQAQDAQKQIDEIRQKRAQGATQIINCKDEPEGQPIITSISPNSGSQGTMVEVRGCNFSGFEGDKDIWIKNQAGVKGIMFGESGSTSNLIKITLPSRVCQLNNSYSGLPCDKWLDLISGTYQLYTEPWGKKSNEVSFVITSSDTSTWKTYTNSQYGFEFKYPNQIQITQSQNAYYTIQVSATFYSKSILSYLEGANYEAVQTDPKISTSIDGKKYTMWIHAFPGGTEYRVILDLKRQIDFTNFGGNADFDVFNKILSTFKFTK